MTYHISPRVLEMLARGAPKRPFADCIQHVLSGSQPANRQFQLVQALASKPPSVGVLERHIRELWTIDLNPIARLAHQLKSPLGAARIWNAYNAAGNVTTPSFFSLESKSTEHLPKKILPSRTFQLIDLSTTLIEILTEVLTRTTTRKTENSPLSSNPHVSTLARILGQEHRIVYEASLFFEAHPGANVAELSKALGCHQRTLERQFRHEGLTAVALKRACALVGASRDLWAGASLAEIAYTWGYADQAHMSREISRATGGLSPSFLRSCLSC